MLSYKHNSLAAIGGRLFSFLQGMNYFKSFVLNPHVACHLQCGTHILQMELPVKCNQNLPPCTSSQIANAISPTMLGMATSAKKMDA